MIGSALGGGGLSGSGGSAGPATATGGTSSVGGDYFNFTTTGLNLGEIIKAANEGNSMTGGQDGAISSLAGFVTRESGATSKISFDADTNIGYFAIGGAVILAFLLLRRRGVR